ncbi:MAG: 50S ribosomal protein L13 [Bacillota bacterium]|nr:50S ribosomal protein L13 [Bacillota bacterium]
MSTFMANPQTVERKWYIVDANGKTLGRLAAEISVLLNGKHKTTYTSHVDCGDNVIVLNAAKVKLTGKKPEQKYYRTHSGYPGGLKEVQYSRILATKPEFAIKIAVRGMLPKNSIGRNSLTRLHIFNGAEHNHQAQMPEVYNK